MARARSPLDRQIAALAVPALGALIAEPLFIATDTAMIGHLGATPLAAIGIAGTVLQTIVGLLVFLAYATTPAVARRMGAGDIPGAMRAGIDGLWLALLVGVLLVAAGIPLAPTLVGWFGADAAVTAGAVDYLTISLWGLPGMLLLVAATGLFRGLRDTRTPLWIAVAGFAANAALNAALIYGTGWGLVGSAIGSAIAQTGMGVVAAALCIRHARRAQVTLLPGGAGILASVSAGGWLFVRTLSLRIALIATIAAATAHGTVALASTQVLFTLFSLLALALDALAIAGQAMIGHSLGSGDRDGVTAIVRRLLQLGAIGGVAVGALLAAASGVLGRVFTNDEAVLAALAPGFLVLAIGMPIAAVVFVLDGVLIGAGDARYLAWTGIVNLAVVLPLLVLVGLADVDAVTAVVAVQLVFAVGFMLARLTTLGLRARGERWMVLGHR